MSNREIKTNEVYDNLVDNYLMHYGRSGQKKKGVHQFGKWQSQAVYAQGKPNPDAKVRGERESRSAKLGRLSNEIQDAFAVGDKDRALKAAKNLLTLNQPRPMLSRDNVRFGIRRSEKTSGKPLLKLSRNLQRKSLKMSD